MNVQRWAHALLAAAIAAPSLVSAAPRADILLVKQHDPSSPGLLPWNTMPMVQARPGQNFIVRNDMGTDIAAFADKADSYVFPGEFSVDTVQVLKGDFDGDGMTDLALLDRFQNATGTMSVAYRRPDGGVNIRQEPIGPFAAWATDRYASEAVTGDFNGDGRTDIALIRRYAGGTMAPMLLSQAGGGFSAASWNLGVFAGWASDSYQVRIVTGDFDGDGRTDIALVRPCGPWASIPIAYGAPTRFNVVNHPAIDFAQTCPAGANTLVTGDFNGDGATDLVRFSGGSMVVAEMAANRLGFNIYRPPFMEVFSRRAEASRVLVGKFAHPSYDSIALVDKTVGSGGIAMIFGGLFGFRNAWVTDQLVPDFAYWATAPGASAYVGDFDGNGLSDIALLQASPGQDWTTIPIAYSKIDSINSPGCSLPLILPLCRNLQVENQPAPGFVGWVKQRGVGVFIGEFAK